MVSVFHVFQITTYLPSPDPCVVYRLICFKWPLAFRRVRQRCRNRSFRSRNLFCLCYYVTQIFREIIKIIFLSTDRETKFTMAPPKKIRKVNQPSTSSGTNRRKKKPESDESDSEFLPSTSNSISKPKAQPNRKTPRCGELFKSINQICSKSSASRT